MGRRIKRDVMTSADTQEMTRLGQKGQERRGDVSRQEVTRLGQTGHRGVVTSADKQGMTPAS